MASEEQAYDRLGGRYAATRRTDPSIADRVQHALGDADTVLNVGAGTGSYEPSNRRVMAVEPSLVMIAQRPPHALPAVRAPAEELPFASRSFDAAMAVLTIHHWKDARKGLMEMRRVAKRRVVILTWDQEANEKWWLPMNYFPGIREIDRQRVVPIEFIGNVLGSLQVEVVPIRHDCQDGFDIAFWRHPEAYINPVILSAMSNFAALDPTVRAAGVRRLADDLSSGAWRAQFGHLLELSELDLGLRLLTHETLDDRSTS